VDTLIRLSFGLFVLAVLVVGVGDLVRALAPIPVDGLLSLLIFGSIALFGFFRWRARGEEKPAKRPGPRRRALPPPPGNK
jgi:hypothetical protein